MSFGARIAIICVMSYRQFIFWLIYFQLSTLMVKKHMKIFVLVLVAAIGISMALVLLKQERQDSFVDTESTIKNLLANAPLNPNGDEHEAVEDEVQFEKTPESKEFERKLKLRNTLLAGIDSEDVVISDTNQSLVRLRKGFAGISNVEFHRGDDWTAVHEVIAALVPFSGSEALTLGSESHIDGDQQPIYQFQQKVNGIDVEGAILEIKVDESTGRIVDVYSSLVSDKSLPQPNLGAIEAVNIAKHKAMETGAGTSVHSEPRLVYVRTPNKDEVDLFWKLSINNKEAYVNAVDGSVSLKTHQRSNAYHKDTRDSAEKLVDMSVYETTANEIARSYLFTRNLHEKN